MKNHRTLIIIPAYNEEDNILKTYEKIINYNKKHNKNHDVLVINDGSKDNTEAILCKNKIRHIKLINNLGIGGAVQTGYKYALENNYDYAVQFDGDGQHNINYIDEILEPLIKNDFDMTIGSRFIEKIDTFRSSKARRIGIRIISFFIKFVTGKKIYDTTSGMRGVNKKLIQEFASYYPTEYPEPVSTTYIIKMGYRINEISVEMNERENGISSIRKWKSIYYMVNVILSILITGFGGKR